MNEPHVHYWVKLCDGKLDWCNACGAIQWFDKGHGKYVLSLACLACDKGPEVTAEERFVRHIEGHLSGDQIPICKICGKTILEIDHEAGVRVVPVKEKP